MALRNVLASRSPTTRMDRARISTDLVLATGIELVQKLASYFVLAMLARRFDSAAMGGLFLVLAIAQLAAAATELGTGRYLVREVAQRPDEALARLGAVLTLRAPLAAVALLCLVGGFALARPSLLAVAVPASAAILLSDLYYAFGAFLIGGRRVGLRLATGAIGPVLLVVAVGAALAAGLPLPAVLAGWAMAAAAAVVATAAVVRRGFGPIPWPDDSAAARRIAAESAPFFALTILGLAHLKADTFLLYALASPAAVASYEVGYKLLEASRLAVRPAVTVFYPRCAELAARGDWPALARLLRRILAGGFALAIAVTVGVRLGAVQLLDVIWGSRYAGSAPVLATLVLAVPAVYLGVVLTFAAGALRLEGAAAGTLAGALAANVLINLLVIPRWTTLGAAWATVATETAAALALLMVVAARLRGGADPTAPAPATARAP
jgi:O-antigen/teichoic acid export membrane protein